MIHKEKLLMSGGVKQAMRYLVSQKYDRMDELIYYIEDRKIRLKNGGTERFTTPQVIADFVFGDAHIPEVPAPIPEPGKLIQQRQGKEFYELFKSIDPDRFSVSEFAKKYQSPSGFAMYASNEEAERWHTQ